MYSPQTRSAEKGIISTHWLGITLCLSNALGTVYILKMAPQNNIAFFCISETRPNAVFSFFLQWVMQNSTSEVISQLHSADVLYFIVVWFLLLFVSDHRWRFCCSPTARLQHDCRQLQYACQLLSRSKEADRPAFPEARKCALSLPISFILSISLSSLKPYINFVSMATRRLKILRYCGHTPRTHHFDLSLFKGVFLELKHLFYRNDCTSV